MRQKQPYSGKNMNSAARLESAFHSLHINLQRPKKAYVDLARIANELYLATARGSAGSRGRAMEDLRAAFDAIMQASKKRHILHDIRLRSMTANSMLSCELALDVQPEWGRAQRAGKRTVRVVERDGEVRIAFNEIGGPRKYGPAHKSEKELYWRLRLALQETANTFGVSLEVSPFADNAFFKIGPLGH
ncbi:MAG: hypothetical protein WC861_03230 [Candidatus Micrarchaeia archaeon]